MKVLAIDIGYHNMGIILTEFEDNPKIDIKFMKRVDLDDYKYIRTNDAVDLIPLFVEDHQDAFDTADKILIERQPPGGFTNLEILLHYMFKDKVVLISPVSMHCHFGMRHLDYDERKERTVALTEKFLNVEIPYERKHDIADAFCMVMYYHFKVCTHIFDRFRYFPKK